MLEAPGSPASDGSAAVNSLWFLYLCPGWGPWKGSEILSGNEGSVPVACCCLPPISDSGPGGRDPGSMLQMLAVHHGFPGISGHRNFHPAVLCIAVQQSEVAYPA